MSTHTGYFKFHLIVQYMLRELYQEYFIPWFGSFTIWLEYVVQYVKKFEIDFFAILFSKKCVQSIYVRLFEIFYFPFFE